MVENSKTVVPYPKPTVQKDQVANRINSLHFRNQLLLVELRHQQHQYSLTLKAVPEVCHGKFLRAHWENLDEVPHNLHQFNLIRVIIPDMASSFELCSKNAYLEHDSLQLEIPVDFKTVASRSVCRQPGNPEIKALLTQNSICFEGNLTDYSPKGIKLNLKLIERQSIYMFNPGSDISLTLKAENRIVFAGSVAVLRAEGDADNYTVVVAPIEDNIPRYRTKEDRTKRYPITPHPDINFKHPLTGERVTLPVKDIADLGVLVQEDSKLAILLPGLILEKVELSVFGSPFVTFNAQVVHNKEEENHVLSGLAILDIDVEDHYRLIGLVHRAEDDNAYVRLNKDPEKFFDFLFNTGFMYPAKYEEVHKNKTAFVDGYHKLYLNPNRIARCFVYLEDGQILGHVSALKIYRNTWLNHHHAALKSRKAGLKVLKQISDFHTHSYVLNPLHMRYVVGIWRPNNEFPSKFFGRFTETLHNPALCSIDTFSYLKVKLADCRNWDQLKGPWEIAKATRQDLREFDGYYRHVSGGLLSKAFDLTPDSFDDETIATEYAASGLKRNRFLYAVRYGLDLKALVEVQDTNLGLNMSELTSAVYIYILDEKMITPKVLDFIQCMVSVKTQREDTTVMLYPHTYAQRYHISVEKEYSVWILHLNVEGTDAYVQHLSRYCR